jgi:hypothetical protein
VEPEDTVGSGNLIACKTSRWMVDEGLVFYSQGRAVQSDKVVACSSGYNTAYERVCGWFTDGMDGRLPGDRGETTCERE